ncbi:hypothetical protein [Paenibacillus sp. RUD330]|uniref:hypothetical protein n=1 Tax=Paenibacillus sp. RUD330 TaxID=2023772 RepID=UPI000B92D3E0|nr:hypothetical protein [Paenibacillus sp. RUD330]ASS64672.1 hypothetical protein CIC07_00055 [Paenibacillus sp. RUD330]
MKTQKVKMLVSISSADWSLAPGDQVELDAELAAAWIECGHAKADGKADEKKLPEGVEYLGFGRYLHPNGMIQLHSKPKEAQKPETETKAGDNDADDPGQGQKEAADPE